MAGRGPKGRVCLAMAVRGLTTLLTYATLCIDKITIEETMPRLSQATITRTPQVEFIFSAALDMMNAMYFASLVPQIEGVDGWPGRVRHEMAPDVLAELDFLYNYPAGDPGIAGILCDNLFANPEARRDVESLLAHVRTMVDGVGDLNGDPGIQGLIYQTTFRHVDDWERAPYEGLAPRDAVEQRMRALEDRDAEAIMQLYDQPRELRARIVRLVERFYEEHYQHELPRRMASLERSVAAHRGEPPSDPNLLARKLTRRPTSCLEEECQGVYDKVIFAPSLDMGPYSSCVSVGGVHGFIYACEPEFVGEAPEQVE